MYKMKKLIKPLVITVLCLIVIVAGAVYYLTPNTLEVVVAGRLTVSPELMGTGKVEGDRRIVIYSDVAGVIEESFVRTGDRVKAGDALLSYKVDEQTEQVELAQTDARYSEEIAQAAKNNRQRYENRYNAAVKKIAECEQVYAVLEQNMIRLNSENHVVEYDIEQRKKTIESDISKLEEQVSEKQTKLAKYEMKMKVAELEENDKDMDDYVDDAKDIQDDIAELNHEISKLQRDVICLPQEGMDPQTYDRYLVLQNNLDTVMRLWSEAKTEKDTTEPLMNAYGEVLSDELSAQHDRLSLDKAQKELGRANSGTAAPATGVITECLVDAGAYVEKGVPVMVMQSCDSYKVSMMVSKYDIPYVKEGQTADIRIGDSRYEGRVSRIQQAAANDVSGKARAGIEVAIDTQEELIVGLDCDVTIKLESAVASTAVPNECIYNDDGGAFVYTVEDDEVKKTYVTTGVKDSEYTQVEGIAEGTHVVSDAAAAQNLGEEIREDIIEKP